jgi:hypothetical protein
MNVSTRSRTGSTLSLLFLRARPSALSLVLEIASRLPAKPVVRHHKLDSIQPLSYVHYKGGSSSLHILQCRTSSNSSFHTSSVQSCVSTEPCCVAGSSSITGPTDSTKHLFEPQLPHQFHSSWEFPARPCSKPVTDHLRPTQIPREI